MIITNEQKKIRFAMVRNDNVIGMVLVLVCAIISYGSLERNRFSFRMITFSGSNAIFVYDCLEFQVLLKQEGFRVLTLDRITKL